ncbi:hypothetical protein ACLKA7_002852 [Drosophila subpalustris]
MWHQLWRTLMLLAIILMFVKSDKDEGDKFNDLDLADMKVYTNEVVPYGEKTSVVITIQRFPRRKIKLRLSTETYLLAYRELGTNGLDMPPRFRRSRNISNTLERLNINPSISVTYIIGYFANVRATFWDRDYTILRLEGSVPSMPSIEPIFIEVRIKVASPNVDCVPVLKMSGCQNPQTPQKVVLLRSTILRAHFEEKCGMGNAVLTWNLFNLDESKLLTTFSNERLIFVLKRYSLRYSTEHELWRNLYVLRPEGYFHSTKFAARCYVEAITGKVEAVIAGGATRNAIISRHLLMDGSFSRDYSKTRNVKQFESYQWDCVSQDDYRNPFCRSNMFKVSTFRMHKNFFKLHCQYEFTLSVKSDDNPKVKSETKQLVTMVKYEVLHVAIVCLENCANYQYNPLNKVQLLGKCLDCGQQQVIYSWHVGGQYTLSKKNLTMHISTQGTIAKIQLSIRLKDGTSGHQVMLLTKRVPPTGTDARCTVEPQVGIEATTPFYVCCKKFETKHEPIEYFFYAGRELLTRCYRCDCKAYLPVNLKTIRVLICDNLLTCGESSVDVTVTPLANVTVDKADKVSDFISTDPNNIVEMANHGRLNRFFQFMQSMATRIKDVDSGTVLMNAFKYVHPTSLANLGKMANFTRTFGIQLTPIDTNEQNLLTASLTKLNEIFDAVYKNQIHQEMIEQPYVNVTVACVTVYDMMDRLNKKMPRPPQSIFDEYRHALDKNKLDQNLVNQLTKEIASYDNEEAKNRSMSWLNAMWQTERLYRFLEMARKHGFQPDPNEIVAEAVSLEIQCFDIDPEKHYTIKTSDRMHIVYFSPELLKEAKPSFTNYICLKVVSTIRELNWWYPEEKQPSSVLLSVRIYFFEDTFEVEQHLYHSEIRFKTIVGKYKPAVERPESTGEARESSKMEMLLLEEEGMHNKSRAARSTEEDEEDDGLIFAGGNNVIGRDKRPDNLDDDEDEYAISDAGRYINCLEIDTLEYMQWIRLYRINLEGHAMVTVRFKESTHELQVLLFIGETPKEWKPLVNKSKCFVPARSGNKTMVIRNNCNEHKRAYMAIQINGAAEHSDHMNTPVKDGPAVFSFVFQERSCDYWTYSLPKESQHWSHGHCLPVLEYQKKGTIHCSCTLLGTYTSYVYHIPAIVIPLQNEHVHFNFVLLASYLVIFALIFGYLLLLVIYCNKRPSKTVVCDMSAMDYETTRDVHDLLIFLKTGGRINAQTTATVRLIFQTTQRAELQFTIMQDPAKPQLTRNSTYVLLVRTRDIRIPTRIAVAHNNAGRYPSWYLRRIEILDVQKQLTQIFIVNRWVRQKFLILSSSMVLKSGEYRIVEKWRERFINEFERLWINWGFWHPLTGTWRDSKNYMSLSRAQRSCVFVSKMLVTYTIVACLLGHSTRHSAYQDRKIHIKFKDLGEMFMYCAIATNLRTRNIVGITVDPGSAFANLSTSTKTTDSSALANASQLTYNQLEEHINKWTLEFEEQEKVFTEQATQINAWDKLLIGNNQKIIELNDAVQKVKNDQQVLDQELEFIATQHKELEESLAPLEKEFINLPRVDQERSQTYLMVENEIYHFGKFIILNCAN